MSDDMTIIKYYGDGDLGLGPEAEKVVKALDGFDDKRREYTLNEILSLYNITRFTDKDVWLKRLSAEDIERYKALRGPIERLLKTFFDGVTEENVEERLGEVDQRLNDDLLLLMLRYGLFERIPKTTLLKVLKMQSLGMHYILQNAKLVKLCSDEIKAELLDNERHDGYVIRGVFCNSDRKDIFLPELTGAELDTIINRYLESDHAHPNYVDLIAENTHVASPKTRLKAKRRSEQLTRRLLKRSPGGVEFGLWAKVVKDQEEPIKIVQDETNFELSYSKKFLDSLTSGEAIAEFCMGGLGFADEDALLDFPAYRSENTSFTSLFEHVGAGAYPATSSFQMKTKIMLMSVGILEHYLETVGHGIEEGIAWFFNRYLEDAYGVKGFRYNTTTSDSYREKARHVLLAVDTILVQFKCFVEEGEVDHELCSMVPGAPVFSEVPSLCPDKYVYADPKSEDMKRIMAVLFSDRARLYSDAERLDYLVQKGLVKKVSDGFEINPATLGLMRKLRKHEVIAQPYCTEEAKQLLEQWQKKGWVKYSSSLLSPAEVDYYNYAMNNKFFTNSLALRNKYAHGAETFQSEDEDRNDYIMALLLMVGLMIKIRADFIMRPKD